MVFSKHLGFIHVELYRITKVHQDTRADIYNELLMDIITVLAKYEVVTDNFIFDFINNEDCDKRDIFHMSLIKAGMKIEKKIKVKKSKKDYNTFKLAATSKQLGGLIII